MGQRRNVLRAGAWLRTVAVALLLATGVQAQGTGPAAILTLDQERFFVESDFGRSALERERAATVALEQENKRIEAQLVAEEQALTELRKTLPPAEFAAKADAFDAKVVRIRSEQDAKAQVLSDNRDKDRTEFLKVAVPVLGALLGEKQAVAIIDKNQVIVALSAIDITDEAIAKVNAALAKPAEP